MFYCTQFLLIVFVLNLFIDKIDRINNVFVYFTKIFFDFIISKNSVKIIAKLTKLSEISDSVEIISIKKKNFKAGKNILFDK